MGVGTTCCGMLRHCNTLQHTSTCYTILQHTAPHLNTLQLIVTHCNTLQHTSNQKKKDGCRYGATTCRPRYGMLKRNRSFSKLQSRCGRTKSCVFQSARIWCVWRIREGGGRGPRFCVTHSVLLIRMCDMTHSCVTCVT